MENKQIETIYLNLLNDPLLKNIPLTENLINKGKDIAKIISPLKLDDDTYFACFFVSLLNEVTLPQELILKYKQAYELALSVKEISNFDYQNKQEEMENLRSMLIAIAKDIRVMIIRLAEVLYLARHTNKLSSEEAKVLHTEIKEIYSPIASRLGLSFIKSELNDLNLYFLKPTEYKKLMKQVAEDSRNGTQRIANVVEKIKTTLDNLSIKGDCYGRVKHISSLYNKLQQKGKTLAQIYDLCAIRVIVPTQNDCYAVLGALHTEFIPIDSRFKDYIARPKVNGYQSLHTVIIIDNAPIEIQIRTFDMHNHAEYGIAAHFLYKERKNKFGSLDDKLLWIRKLLDNNDNSSANDILEQLKTDVYSGEIFVQTPMGKILQLTESSTPIDFAYAIHSEVGNKCVGARVNGKMVPLTTELQNGDIVEIITNQNSKGPSRDWLKVAKSSSTKNKINQFFRREMKDENIKKGKSILEQAAKNKGYVYKDLSNDEWMQQVLNKYAFNTEDEMYAAVGYGSMTSTQVINKLIDIFEKHKPQKPKEAKVIAEKENKYTDIEGLSGILVKYAKCCNPIPGDDIVGFVSRGSGVTIHRKDCVALKAYEQDRIMPMQWGNHSDSSNYIASLRLYVDNLPGVLASITTKLAEQKINITKIKSTNNGDDEAIIDLSFYVKNKQELEDFSNKLKTLSIIRSIERGGK